MERAHLLGGAYKTDDEDLIVVLCGAFGNPECRVHQRYHSGERATAGHEIGRALRTHQVRALITAVGAAGAERRYPMATFPVWRSS